MEPNGISSPSGQPAPASVAKTPFDDPRADIILRSSDNVDFKVFKIILDLASPVFRDMLTVPQPAIQGDGDGENPIPSVEVTESSKVLDVILRFCYPTVPPKFDCADLTLIHEVLRSAMKYDIQVAIIPARSALMENVGTSSAYALRAYAIACNLKMEEEARIAARAYLKWPALGAAVHELASLSALDYHNLLVFHQLAFKAVISRFKEQDFLSDAFTTLSTKGKHSRRHLSHECTHERLASQTRSEFGIPLNRYTYDWWDSSKSALKDALNNAPLATEGITLHTIAPKLEDLSCGKCRNSIFRNWEETRVKIIAAIEEEVNKVKLVISWK